MLRLTSDVPPREREIAVLQHPGLRFCFVVDKVEARRRNIKLIFHALIAVFLVPDVLQQPHEAERINGKAADESEGAAATAVASSAPEQEDMLPSSTGDQMPPNAEQVAPETEVCVLFSLRDWLCGNDCLPFMLAGRYI